MGNTIRRFDDSALPNRAGSEVSFWAGGLLFGQDVSDEIVDGKGYLSDCNLRLVREFNQIISPEESSGSLCNGLSKV